MPPPENNAAEQKAFRMIAVIHFLKQHSHKLLLGLIVALGFLIRLVVALSAPVDPDEGIFIYEGQRILSGDTPFRDFVVRSPLYSYLNALSIILVGPDIFAGRIISVLAATATIALIYGIASKLFDARVALIAALLYAVAPASINYSTVTGPREVALLLMTLTTYIMSVFTKRPRVVTALGLGLTLGIGIWIYRALAFFAVLIPLISVWLYVKKYERYSLKASNYLWMNIILFATLLVIGGAFYVYFASVSSYEWVNYIWGFGGGPQSASRFGSISAFLERSNGKVWFVAMREWIYLLIPAWGLITTYLWSTMTRRFWAVLGIFSLSFLLLVFPLRFEGFPPFSTHGVYTPVPLFRVLFYLQYFLLLLLVLWTIYTRRNRSKRVEFPRKPGLLLLGYWSAAILIFIGLREVWLTNYFKFFGPILAVLAGGFLGRIVLRFPRSRQIDRTARKRVKQRLAAFTLITVVGISIGITSWMLSSTPLPWRNMGMGTAYELSHFIENNSEDGDKILTGYMIIPVLSNRQQVFDQVNILPYFSIGSDPSPYDPFNLFPTIGELEVALSSGAVRYVVLDGRIRSLLNWFPELQDVVEAHYVHVVEIDGIAIFEFSASG